MAITRTYDLLNVNGEKGWVRDSWARRAIARIQKTLSNLVVPTASTANPQMDGTADPGVSTDYARADHVHPRDTTKADAATTYTKSQIDAMIPSVPSASTSNPAMDGTASPGSSTAWARGDHVHPHDTSKQDALSSAQMDAVNSGVTAEFVTGKFAVVTGTLPTSATWGAYSNYPNGFTYTNCVMLSFEVYRAAANDWRQGEGSITNSFSRLYCAMDANGIRAMTNNSSTYGADYRVVLMRTDI